MLDLRESIDVLTPARTVNEYGDPVLDWTNPYTRPVDGCGVASGGSLEPVQAGRDAVVSDFDVVIPAGAAVAATDRVVVRGLTCEVVGRPFEWRLGDWNPGTVLRLKAVEG